MSEAIDNARVAVAVVAAEDALRELQSIREAQTKLANTRPSNPAMWISAILGGSCVGIFAEYGASVSDTFRVVFVALCVLITFLATDNARISRRLEAAILLIESGDSAN